MAFLGCRGTALERKPSLESPHLHPDPTGRNSSHWNWLDFSGLTCVSSHGCCEGSPAREKKSLLSSLSTAWGDTNSQGGPLAPAASLTDTRCGEHLMVGEHTDIPQALTRGITPFSAPHGNLFFSGRIPPDCKGKGELNPPVNRSWVIPQGSFHLAAPTSLSGEETYFLQQSWWHLQTQEGYLGYPDVIAGVLQPGTGPAGDEIQPPARFSLISWGRSCMAFTLHSVHCLFP